MAEIWGTKKKGGRTSFCAQVFQFEGLGCLEGKYGVTLLDDVEIVVVVAERAVEAVVVHFSQNKLEGGRKKNKLSS